MPETENPEFSDKLFNVFIVIKSKIACNRE
jgi:hypothetical protein